MTQRLPFQDFKTAVIAGNGTALVEMGPTSYKESWETWVVGVQNTPTPPALVLALVPTARIYLANIFVGGTFTGDLDSDTSMNLTIQSGQKLRAVWSGGDPGSLVTLTVTGTKVLD
jgi:hypothetical protein